MWLGQRKVNLKIKIIDIVKVLIDIKLSHCKTIKLHKAGTLSAVSNCKVKENVGDCKGRYT